MTNSSNKDIPRHSAALRGFTRHLEAMPNPGTAQRTCTTPRLEAGAQVNPGRSAQRLLQRIGRVQLLQHDALLEVLSRTSVTM